MGSNDNADQKLLADLRKESQRLREQTRRDVEEANREGKDDSKVADE